VAARSGGATVRNASGVLVANLRTGMALAFDTGAAASTAVQISGLVELRNGNYLVTDGTTQVVSQLQGADLAQYAGKKVDVTGSLVSGPAPLAGATQVVHVIRIRLAATGAAGAAGAAVAGSHVAAIAVIGGVGVGGTVVGLAAAGSFSGPASTSGK